MKKSIDTITDDWEEQLIRRWRGSTAIRRTVTGTKRRSNTNTDTRTPLPRLRQTIKLMTRRAPEVMVKISGASNGARRLQAHFDYISRNGALSVETDDGQVIVGREGMRELAAEWKYGFYGLPEESNRRECLHLVLSMPPGTDRDSVRQAASEFAKSQFADNHQYALVAHEDEAHPHVHLCVKMTGIDGTRLNPRKAELQQWREKFADCLNDNGIEAAATPRTARFSRIQTNSQHQRHTTRDAPKQQKQGLFPAEKLQLARYTKLSLELAHAGPEGVQLAKQLQHAIKGMPGLSKALERTTEKTPAIVEPIKHTARSTDRSGTERS